MNKEDFYIGQKIKLPQEDYDYHLECYGEVLDEYAVVTSLEKLETHNIVHYKIQVIGEMWCMIHSGIDYKKVKSYEPSRA
jgi:hypothetical protein